MCSKVVVFVTCQIICLAFAPSPLRSFALSQDQVHEATDESHGEADPGQDVGGAIGALLKADRVKAVFLICVDGGCDHHAQSWREEAGKG